MNILNIAMCDSLLNPSVKYTNINSITKEPEIAINKGLAPCNIKGIM